MLSQLLSYIFLFCFLFYIFHAHSSKAREKHTFSLDFLDQMHDVQRGDLVKGVHELKDYLSYLGYLNYNSSDFDNQKHELKNTFDESLEFALKKFQEIYGLNATGILDVNTISQMQKPRCGLPDFYNPNNNTVHFLTVSHYSLLPVHPKWPKKWLSYAFDKNVKDEAKPPLERALKAWASSTPFKFYRVGKFHSFEKGNIRISFLRGHHGDTDPFLSGSHAAHTFPPPDGRVHFNAAQNWSSNGDKNALDIQTVGTHEFGHVLGLGHSEFKEAIMYPYISEGEIKGLHKDDIKGIKALYKYK